MVKQKAPSRKGRTVAFRASSDDLEVIEVLKKKTGIRADGEILRQAIRAMLKQEKARG